MQPHQERVINEREELDKKLDKLSLFIKSEAFRKLEEEDKSLLEDQEEAMLHYSEILGLRIAYFQRQS